MNYLPTLETERLIIRPITMDDLQDFYEMDSQPEVHTFLRNHRKFIDSISKNWTWTIGCYRERIGKNDWLDLF